MPVNTSPSEIPVLLLYNLDPKWSASDKAEIMNVTSQVYEVIRIAGHQTTLVQVTDSDLDSVLSEFDPHEYVVFNWCENLPGIPNSEGLVVEYLEQHGFTFTGSSSATLALALDKYSVKRLFDEAKILTPKWGIYDKVSSVNWKNFPAIVKPSKEHCSEGINRNAVVMTEATMKNRVRYIIKRFQQPALVEDFIDGREFHISLWGNTDLEMLPPAEMEFSLFKDKYDRLCTYESKFVPNSPQYKNIQTLIPAPLSEDELHDVEQACKAAYMLIGCRDYARIDMRMKDGLFYIIDVNPNADISPDTSTISAVEFMGYKYSDFIEKIILLSAQRHPKWGEQIYSSNPGNVST